MKLSEMLRGYNGLRKNSIVTGAVKRVKNARLSALGRRLQGA